MKKGPMGSTPAVRPSVGTEKDWPCLETTLLLLFFLAMAVVQLEQYYAGMDPLVMLSQVVVVLVYWRLSSPGWAEMRVTSP